MKFIWRIVNFLKFYLIVISKFIIVCTLKTKLPNMMPDLLLFLAEQYTFDPKKVFT